MVAQTGFGLYIPPDSAHWYFYDGQPCYEVLKSDYSGYRNTTLRDAKKLNLVPSVTSIMKVLYRPALERWKMEQTVLAAMTLPKIEGERDYEFANRIIEDSRTEGMAAADFGTHIHSLIEWYIKSAYLGNLDEDFDFLPDDKHYLRGWKNWADEVGFIPELVEISFASLLYGFGGKIDCIGTVEGRRCVIDWKTQKTKTSDLLHEKDGSELKFYPEWRPQLAAYWKGMGWSNVKDLCSVAISSTEPGVVQHQFWDDPEDGWEEFSAMKRIWYSPIQGNTKELYEKNLLMYKSGVPVE